MTASGTAWERALRPVHRWVWRDAHRRARKLFTFSETEADGGRDLSRAAELTLDPLLRTLFFRHAEDERRHAGLMRDRARAIAASVSAPRHAVFEANWIAPGERGGRNDVPPGPGSDASLLAFLHLSEKAAAARFTIYGDVVPDRETREMFRSILRDEVFHMAYTRAQLQRIDPSRFRFRLWAARAKRLWKAYLRVASFLALVIGTAVLLAQYFVLVPLFAWAAKRSARREHLGWSTPIRRVGPDALRTQY